jgi:pyridoxamine 5'-phosphate oxidase
MSSLSHHIAQIREDYSLATLDETVAGDNPIFLFEKWFKEAEAAAIIDVNAMSLATIDATLQPHLRTVLLKGIEDNGFVFYTNYQSKKGQDISHNNKVALLFFWKELQRQIRIEGIASKLSEVVSDQYFNSRPRGSKIGAIASPQSQVLADREHLEQAVATLQQKYIDTEMIPRPLYWGGYTVHPSKMEFWQGRSNRLHDRIVFELDSSENWKKYRIAP